MSANINLLLRSDEESLKRKKRVKILNFVAGAFLVGLGLTSLVIFLLIQSINPPSVKKEQEDILKSMSTLQDRQVKLFVLNNRVENIDKILATRRDLSIVTNSLLEKTPSELSIDNLEVDDKSVVITAQSTSLSIISEFINNLIDMVRKKEKIRSLTLNSLIFDESRNVYQVSIKGEL